MRQGVFTPKLKLLWHRDRIDQWLSTGDCVPVMVEMDLTNRCDLKCNFCTFDYIKDRSDIDTEVALKAIADMAEMGVRSVNFTGGGEPSLHKDFQILFRWAKRKGMGVGIFTNGMHLTPELSQNLVTYCDWVRVSLDCASEEMFKKTKGVYGFSRVKQSIYNLVKAKAAQNSKCTVGMGFVITDKNFLEIPEFSKLSKDLHVDYAQYKPEIKNCFSTDKHQIKWWVNEVKPLLEGVMETNEKAVINLYKFNDLVGDIDREYSVCYGHNFVPCIGATGDVWVCTHLRNISGYSYGNLSQQSFKEIWASDKRQEVIKKIDLSKCQKYCRNNEINKVLFSLKENNQEGHYNFL